MNPADLPTVLIVGGPDVDARIDLMQRMRAEFACAAAGSDEALQSRFAAAGFAYYTYPLNRGVAPLADLHALYRLWRLFRQLRPQLVHTFDPKPSVWGRLAARMAGVPAIVGTLPGLGSLYTSDTPATRLVRQIYQPLQRLACHSSQLTIFQNQVDARQFIAAGVVAEADTLVMPGSGIATDIFAPERVSADTRARLRAELGIAPGELVVTMISRLLRQKGVPEFVAAARQLRQQHPNARCLLVGAEDPESLDRLSPAELAELRAAVIWPGSRRDIPAILAISDVFVLPSAYREGIPRVLLEAAAMRLPIVTTDAPGCNEVVRDGVSGWLIPTHDAAALSRAVAQLLAQPELRRRFGAQARRDVIERFDLSLVAGQTAQLYRRLLQPAQPASATPA